MSTPLCKTEQWTQWTLPDKWPGDVTGAGPEKLTAGSESGPSR